MSLHDLPTPALILDHAAFAANVAAMATARPGSLLRPHVKAFKSTALARHLVAAGHDGFCCATVGEMVGMARAGLGDDLLLANEVVDPRRLAVLGELAAGGSARITVAVDSAETVDAAAAGGVPEVLIDVLVGLPRCGVEPDGAAALADRARSQGLTVRGVMGYEGHLVHITERQARADAVEHDCSVLVRVAEDVGGDVVSGGGTGTFDVNPYLTEVQAGSYTLMDGEYGDVEGLPFVPALRLLTTVISVNRTQGLAVLDGGIKALGMDQGPPGCDGAAVLFCSDEHTVIQPDPGVEFAVGDRVALLPRHVDPTVAKHPEMHVVVDGDVVDRWAVDLRDWQLADEPVRAHRP